MSKRPRAERPVRRMATEVYADSRTHRERTRSDAERAAVERDLADLEDDRVSAIDFILDAYA